MTYKETIFFIGKCLTISHEEKNKSEIETELKNNSVDWDAVVKVSTEHYVFPALYCNLKRADFLHYLPEDLVGYMEHITNLNRERNQQIIEQAKEINELLLANNITPIFLKGTGNLLEGLYEDIGERMVGDIDFIVSKEEYFKSILILENNEYSIIEKNVPKFHRHYPSLAKKNRIAGVEVHIKLLREKYSSKFDFSHIKDNLILKNKFHLISYKNQLHYTILVHQINDYGIHYNLVSLRNAYDVFILSRKININIYLQNLKSFKTEINCFIAICNKMLNSSIIYFEDINVIKYINIFEKLIQNKKYRTKFISKKKSLIKNLNRIKLLFISFYKREHLLWLLFRISKIQKN